MFLMVLVTLVLGFRLLPLYPFVTARGRHKLKPVREVVADIGSKNQLQAEWCALFNGPAETTCAKKLVLENVNDPSLLQEPWLGAANKTRWQPK